MVTRLIIHEAAMQRMLHFNSRILLMSRGELVAQRARQLVPVNTGKLRQSIEATLTERGGIPVCIIGSDVEYAAYVHEGTGIYGPHHQRITPRRGKYMVFEINGEMVFARSTSGMRPTHYLTRALSMTFK